LGISPETSGFGREQIETHRGFTIFVGTQVLPKEASELITRKKDVRRSGTATDTNYLTVRLLDFEKFFLLPPNVNCL
jgi:hypothetical protein